MITQLYKHCNLFLCVCVTYCPSGCGMLIHNRQQEMSCHHLRVLSMGSIANRNLVFVAPHWHVCPWWRRVVSCLPRGTRFIHQTVQHPHIQTRTHMYKQKHTPIIPITRLQQGTSQQPDPAMESQVVAVYVSVCACVCACVRVVEPLGSQGPCRALGVLIRQPQPSRVHHREKERIDWRERLNEVRECM